MNVSLEDPAEPLGIIAGVLLIVSGMGIIARMPWQFTPSGILAPFAQIGGSVAMMAVGAGLVYLIVRT